MTIYRRHHPPTAEELDIAHAERLNRERLEVAREESFRDEIIKRRAGMIKHGVSLIPRNCYYVDNYEAWLKPFLVNQLLLCIEHVLQEREMGLPDQVDTEKFGVMVSKVKAFIKETNE